MNNKEMYIKKVEEKFNGRTKDILLNQINLFYADIKNIEKNK